jgi:hypothetical protein
MDREGADCRLAPSRRAGSRPVRPRCRALESVEQGGAEQGGWRPEPGGQGGRQPGTVARWHGRQTGGSRAHADARQVVALQQPDSPAQSREVPSRQGGRRHHAK